MAFYLFEHEDGRRQIIDDEIHLAQPTDYNRRFPSLLGWDILKYFRLTIDGRTGEVTLD